ncbi:MAG TPA: type II toxin-antitoxin system RelE/ParE family toxin [Nitrosomonas sp.]|nr:type II toxin-antitoxin system RelE/ParE family toxin [Nitrosomonas sp.]HNG37195.1 type II toxin-antitoxin system RelE/ParE family toxin [Nitrosomonas sp.]
MYTVRFSKNAEKALKKIDPVMQRRVLEKIKQFLTVSPRTGPNIKTMQGFSNRYRYRIGDFRVVYEVIDSELVVWVLEADWRGNIY